LRAVVQRVVRGAVRMEDKLISETGPGLVVLLGVGRGDTAQDAGWLADKIAHLRLFEDTAGKMNLSVMEIGGSVLAVSQFTLYGDCRKGRRPGFSEASPPDEARDLYHTFIDELEKLGLKVAAGCFREHMTLLLDSKKNF
jgi:D-tyrosyl-tRNA(Tyr) deacylase